jgi:hypothetical protein
VFRPSPKTRAPSRRLPSMTCRECEAPRPAWIFYFSESPGTQPDAFVAHHTQPGNEGMAEALRAALPACIGRGASITSTVPAAASLFGENNPRLAARPVLRQCHIGNSNAGRDVIEVLTKSAPVLDFHDGWQETNNYAGSCPGGRDSCRGRGRLDCCAAFCVGGVLIRVGFGTQAHGGTCWAFAVRQLPPQGIG